jgi:uncharacterized membrane protein
MQISPVFSPATETREKALMAGGIFQIFVGLVAIIFGLSAGEFYPAFIRKPKPDEKPASKWLGRTIFVIVGIVFILAGISDLRHH